MELVISLYEVLVLYETHFSCPHIGIASSKSGEFNLVLKFKAAAFIVF